MKPKELIEELRAKLIANVNILAELVIIRTMKLIKLVIISALVCTPVSIMGISPAQANEIVAVVNQEIILRSELDQAYEQTLAILSAEDRIITQRQVLEEMVNHRLQLDLARRLNIFVENAELDANAEAIIASSGTSREAFARNLQRQGRSYRDWLEELRESILIRKLQLRELRSYIRVNEAEIDNFLAINTPPQLREAEYDLLHIAIEAGQSNNLDSILSLLEPVNTRDEAQNALMDGGFTDLEPRFFTQRSLTSFPDSFYSHLVVMDQGDVSIFSYDGYFHIVKAFEIDYPQADILQEYRLHFISINNDIIYNAEQIKVRVDDLYSEILQTPDEEKQQTFISLAALNSSPFSIFQNQIGTWLSSLELPQEVSEELMDLEVGEASPPFYYEGAWHIVYLWDTRLSDRTMLKWRNTAYQELVNRKIDVTLPFWISDIANRAYIDYRI